MDRKMSSFQLARAGLVFLLLVSSLTLISATKPVWTSQDKAFYADSNLITFVRPGLKVQILGADISADGTIRARVKFTDPMGLPLDLAGIETPGVISASLIAAYIPAGQQQYVSYATRTVTNAQTGATATQATSDSGGTWEKLASGEYSYVFRTKAPSNVDRTATHTIGLYSRRDLTEFDFGRPTADAVFSFVPDGSSVTVVRDVVKTATCNKCHDRLTLHGRRHSVELCILCHTPQSTDVNSGNTVDMKVMIHRIHLGEGLPSVEAGRPYVVGGNDYSHVVFPADARRCVVCHAPDSGAKQADAWITNPSRAACGSCHDNVNFASGQNHADLPQVSDTSCTQCHIRQGELEFDVSILGAHTIPTESKSLPGVVIDLLEVTGGSAGKSPTVTFTAKNRAGNPIPPSGLDRLRLALIGPTSDYGMNPVQEDARQAQGTTDGRYSYTFRATIPATAKGSWAIGVEARQLVTLLPGTVKEMPNVRDLAFNDVVYFSVDGSPVEPRRTIVSLQKCNACHYKLGLHGGNRTNTEYCVMCHRPGAIAQQENAPSVSIDLRMMVHRIHSGSELANGFRIGNADFSHVAYPGFRQNCSGCHINDSQQLPLKRNLLKVEDASGWLNPVGPEAGACLACHDSIQAASHALANTSALGESCATCHGPNRDFSVDRVHAR